MKKAWKIVLVVVLLASVTCLGLFFLLRKTPENGASAEPTTTIINGVEWVEPTTIRQISENDPFSYVIRAYAALLENRQWSDELYSMSEDQRRNAFAQGFEMLPEDAFLSLLAYRFERSISYVLYDLDGTEMLLLTGPWGLTDIYTIQDGVAVQIKSFDYEDEESTEFLENGIIAHRYKGEVRFYRFEDGMFQHVATLIAGIGGINNYHILADGTEFSVTWEEYRQISGEYGGNWRTKSFAWRPIAEFGR